MICVSLLSDDDYKIYEKARDEISDKYPIRCICGRLCTGLHEVSCKKFKDAVERKYLRLKHLRDKDNEL